VSRYSERQAAKFAQEERIARAQRLIDQLDAEKPDASAPEAPLKPVLEVPRAQELSSESVEDSSILDSLLPSTEKLPARRGQYQGGAHRYYADWFEPLARLAADGTSVRKAAERLGLHFTTKDITRLCILKEFQRLFRAYRRLYHSEVWGQPKEPEVLERLLKHEDAKYKQQMCKPRGAKYISHPRKA
jgi:hypothetical protein